MGVAIVQMIMALLCLGAAGHIVIQLILRQNRPRDRGD
jgi:hypothetical protein